MLLLLRSNDPRIKIPLGSKLYINWDGFKRSIWEFRNWISEGNNIYHKNMTKEQALELLEGRKKLCEKHPYGVTTHLFVFKGIYIEKIELDILKWFLEIE